MDILIPLVFVAALFGVHFYFQSRRHKQPSRLERFFAGLWLLIRRVACFGMALIFCGGGVYAVYQVAFEAAPLSTLFWLGFWLPIGYIFFHWGVYGRGYKQYDFLDDKPVHEGRKKRYGWRW
ncbi:hypothetical protein [Xanthomonas hortorum]|uniref:Uncharacterized protein n=1 Tax=Xanthomonas hortorum TaxID=56454 RepID=A0AA47ES36_9XANT|nr:hypothetical protein [Xanthomonas hortorum]WAH64316.1 hypothetical protein OEG85_23475 [Xanthomonas hortorum]